MDDGWMDIAQISEHPALGLVPPMRPGEYAELKLDIEARGVHVVAQLPAPVPDLMVLASSGAR